MLRRTSLVLYVTIFCHTQNAMANMKMRLYVQILSRVIYDSGIPERIRIPERIPDQIRIAEQIPDRIRKSGMILERIRIWPLILS